MMVGCCRCCFPSAAAKSRKFYCAGVSLSIAAIILAALTVALPFVFDTILVQGIIGQRLVNSFSSASYSQWQTNENVNATPQYFTVYVFHVNNSKAVENGEKPELREIGPFVYRSYWRNFDVKFLENGEVAQFFQMKYYVFDSNRSVGDPHTTLVTVPNVALFGNLGQLIFIILF